MKKIVPVIAAASAAALAVLGIGVGGASAHDSGLSYDCFTVSAAYTNFPSTGVNSATVTVNGDAHDFTWTGPSFDAHVDFVSHSGDPDVVVTSVYSATADGFDGQDSATFPADDCAPAPPTTTITPPTTTVPTEVSPSVAVRAVAAEAVVAAPAFTG
jgi:hypothetical protein